VPKNQHKPEFIKKIETSLGSKLPGSKTHDIMRVGPRIPVPIGRMKKSPIASSVLILLFEENNSFNFILTLRSTKVETHKGQISLPGGVQEKNESLKETALRETKEEIGVLPKTIEIIGELSYVNIPFSGYKVHPYVGWVSAPPKLIPSAQEVERIIIVPVNELIDEKNQTQKKTILRRIPVTMPYFSLKGEIVWGATSMILSEFKQIII
jgi:8-oxo-dGTP pyrophosphatase MutT (NUDIX family)